MGTAARVGTAERLAELIRESRSTVALTGAGISVPSGIPDFRTPGEGLWEKVDPMEVAHIDAFRRDPERFWSFYRPRFETLDEKQPNDAHRALAQLEAEGLLDAVVTQNIDRLHRKAGSRRLIEVHGSIDTSSCTNCNASFPLEQVETLFTNGVAHCSACEGLVKPDVVLFGEFLPEDAIHEAQSLAERCDLMLCVGSSLEVYPVAGLPSIAIASGAKLAIVTQGQTPYDSEADVKLDGDVVFEHVVEPRDGGTRITHRATLDGPLTFLWSPVIGRIIKRGMPDGVELLAELAVEKEEEERKEAEEEKEREAKREKTDEQFKDEIEKTSQGEGDKGGASVRGA